MSYALCDVCCAVVFVPCSLVVTCWERADLLADVFVVFCHFTKCVLTHIENRVGNVSGYRCVSDCRSRGREFDPGPVPYFRGD